MRAERVVPLLYSKGMHLRSAGKFAEIARKFQAAVFIQREGKRLDGKSMIDILSVPTPPGVNLLIEAEGPDAQEAVDTLAALVANKFYFTEE